MDKAFDAALRMVGVEHGHKSAAVAMGVAVILFQDMANQIANAMQDRYGDVDQEAEGGLAIDTDAIEA